jgi:hypothetical protein
MSRIVLSGTLLALVLASPAVAAAVGKGTSIFSVEITNATADLVYPVDPFLAFIRAYNHSDWACRGSTGT